jgi:hypothetical protein
MNATAEAEAMLRSKDSMIGITTVLSEDPERVREVAGLIQNSSALKRYARIQQADKGVNKAASSVPMKDKRAIARSYQQSQNTRQTSGIECVSVLPTGFAKKVFYPTKEKVVSYEKTMLTEEIGYLRSTQPDRTNKYASKITGLTVYGPVIFFKTVNNEVINFSKEEFQSLYSGVNWKR